MKLMKRHKTLSLFYFIFPLIFHMWSTPKCVYNWNNICFFRLRKWDYLIIKMWKKVYSHLAERKEMNTQCIRCMKKVTFSLLPNWNKLVAFMDLLLLMEMWPWKVWFLWSCLWLWLMNSICICRKWWWQWCFPSDWCVLIR